MVQARWAAEEAVEAEEKQARRSAATLAVARATLRNAEAAAAASFARFLEAANAPGACHNMAHVNVLGAVSAEDAAVAQKAREACDAALQHVDS